MGLDTTHDAFSGPYSAFNRFRKDISKAWGGSFPPHDDPLLDPREITFPAEASTEDGLYAFIISNDCEGEFSPEICKKMADEMEALLPKLKSQDPDWDMNFSSYNRAVQYIKGCRLAFKNNETMEYM